MAVRHLEAVQQLSGSAVRTESRPGRIGPITLEVKQAGERISGKSVRCVRRGGDWKRKHGRDAVTLADERASKQGTRTST